jgi:uncharacterized protein involved in exopolysaccharide biosynthesis
MNTTNMEDERGRTGTAPGEFLTLGDLLLRVWNVRWWLFISTVIGAVGLGIFAFSTQPKYRVSTLVTTAYDSRGAGSLSSAVGQLGQIASLAGVSVGGSDGLTEESLAVLRSREFLQEFVNENGLMRILYVKNWDSATNAWKGDRRSWPTLAKAVHLINKQILSVAQDKKSGLVTISVDWKSPKIAEAWSRLLLSRLNAEMRKRALASADAYLGYLEKQLQNTQTLETRNAISRLIEAQTKQKMLASVSPEYAFRVVDQGLAPDLDDPVWPQKKLLIALGAALGVGIALALHLVLLPAWRGSRRRRTA